MLEWIIDVLLIGVFSTITDAISAWLHRVLRLPPSPSWKLFSIVVAALMTGAGFVLLVLALLYLFVGLAA